jgi:hypothetical protein
MGDELATRPTNKKTEELFEKLAAVSRSLGFTKDLMPAKFFQSDSTMSLGREGKYFPTELVVFRLFKRPRLTLAVDFVASLLSHREFPTSGLEGSATSQRLFDIEFYAFRKDPKNVLPKDISLVGWEDWTVLETRLVSSIREAEKVAFQWMKAKLTSPRGG